MVIATRWFDKELIQLVYKAGTDAVSKACFMVEGDAKYFCPVDTDRLRSSISSNWTGSGMDKGKVDSQAKAEDGVGRPTKELTGVVGTNVDYGPYLELGTSKMKPRPHLRVGLHKNEKKIAKMFKNIL